MRSQVARIFTAAFGLSALLGLLAVLAGCGTTVRTPPAPLPGGSAGTVTVQADASTYAPSQPIGVTIRNAGKSTYYVQTNQSECTPIQMQRQVGTAWQSVMPCASGAQAQSAAVTAGLVEPFTFAPGNAPNNPNAWMPGIYRFALQLTTAANGTGTVTFVYSPGIRVSAPSS